MVDLFRDVVGTLALVAGAAALVFFLLAAGAAIVAAYRVGYQRRPLVLTFGGSDESRGAMTTLFAMQLMKIEQEWVSLADAVKAAQAEFNAGYAASPKAAELREGARAPLSEGAELPALDGSTALPSDERAVSVEARRAPRTAGDGLASVGMGPRAVGDEPLDYVRELESDDNSLANADLGVVNVGGVSFSPQAILALLRRLPAACARRRISGTLGQFGETAIIAASYEERPWRGPTRSAKRLVTVDGDWVTAIDTLAFRLAKGHLEVIQSFREEGEAGSDTAERGFIEAESWEACKAFLAGYERHFRHYISGTGSDRDRAVELYAAAIERQPGYTRAHYNRGTLLYNRYRRQENEQAIQDFEVATKSPHDRLRALAFAGLVVGYGQQVHRFGVGKDTVAAKARDASEQALELDPGLEESWFAAGWAQQIDERWSEAVVAYRDIDKLKTTSVPGKRIKSFAYNNAAWIMMTQLEGNADVLLREAEQLLWRALALYPNKIAYANLAEIARRRERYDDAETLFKRALALDSKYVNGWHEFALLELERARRSEGDREKHHKNSLRYEETAERVGDDADRERVRKAFAEANAAYGAQEATV